MNTNECDDDVTVRFSLSKSGAELDVDSMDALSEVENGDGDGDDAGSMTMEKEMEKAPVIDSADIIPEAAMQCGIFPVAFDRADEFDDSGNYGVLCDDAFEEEDGSSDQISGYRCADRDDSPLPVLASVASSSLILLPQQHQPSPDQQVPPSADAGDAVLQQSSSPPSSRRGQATFADAGPPPIEADSVVERRQPPAAAVEMCAGCRRPITERYLLRAVDRNWHEDCLRCSCCDCRLGEVGSTLFTRSNLLLCRRDYLRLFGTTGYCSACSKLIPAFEMIMRAKNNVYHLECFACQRCHQRFCIGDKFYLSENRILCEFDHNEDQRAKLFATVSVAGGGGGGGGGGVASPPAAAVPASTSNSLLPSLNAAVAAPVANGCPAVSPPGTAANARSTPDQGTPEQANGRGGTGAVTVGQGQHQQFTLRQHEMQLKQQQQMRQLQQMRLQQQQQQQQEHSMMLLGTHHHNHHHQQPQQQQCHLHVAGHHQHHHHHHSVLHQLPQQVAVFGHQQASTGGPTGAAVLGCSSW